MTLEARLPLQGVLLFLLTQGNKPNGGNFSLFFVSYLYHLHPSPEPPLLRFYTGNGGTALIRRGYGSGTALV